MLPSVDIVFVSSFLFVFAIIYGLLATAGVMRQKNVNIIIALVFAFFSASYQPFVSMLQGLIPFVSIILLVLFVLVFVKKLIGGGGGKDALPFVVSLAAILMVVFATWDKVYIYFYQFGLDPMNILWIIGILVVIMIFYAVYKHE